MALKSPGWLPGKPYPAPKLLTKYGLIFLTRSIPLKRLKQIKRDNDGVLSGNMICFNDFFDRKKRGNSTRMDWVIAIDVETSGLNSLGGDRVVECAAVKVIQGEIVAEFSQLINVPCKIPQRVSAIHGITSQMLVGMPTPPEVWPVFLAFIGGAALIAHNAPFDIRFIRSELSRLGMNLNNPYVCTLELARRRYPQIKNHQLNTVARHLLGSIPQDCTLHRALGDARLVARVWGKMEGM